MEPRERRTVRGQVRAEERGEGGRRRLNGDMREKSKGVRVPREQASERERKAER
jgi:hypothetical protein